MRSLKRATTRGRGDPTGSRRGRISRLSKSAQIHLLALKAAIYGCDSADSLWGKDRFVLGRSGVGVIRYDYRFGINSCLRLTSPGVDIRFKKSLASGSSSGVEKLADLLRCIGFRRMMVAGTGNLRQWGDGSVGRAREDGSPHSRGQERWGSFYPHPNLPPSRGKGGERD